MKQKYFWAQGGDQWVFYGQVPDKQGQPQTIWLSQARHTRIQRHIKVKGEANPYDPQWELYFEKRVGLKMAQSLQGKKTLRNLWKEQNGICPICGQKITRLTGWHNHHIVWRSKGGSDQAKNRVLIHPNCHYQVHSQGFEVAKPRLENTKSRR